jgi:hypothetical protein
MTTKDNTLSADTDKTSSIRTVPVDDDTLDAVKVLQDQFSDLTSGARISQSVVVNKAVSKLTIADLLPTQVKTA